MKILAVPKKYIGRLCLTFLLAGMLSSGSPLLSAQAQVPSDDPAVSQNQDLNDLDDDDDMEWGWIGLLGLLGLAGLRRPKQIDQTRVTETTPPPRRRENL